MLNYLIEFEENGDIVEVCYNILTKYLSIAGTQSSHENIRVMEKSKNLLSIGIKHTAVY